MSTILILILSLIFTITVASATSRLSLLIRRKRYAKARKVPPPDFLDDFKMPLPERTSSQVQMDDAVKALLAHQHRDAVSLQDASFSHIVSSGALLFSAFTVYSIHAVFLAGNHSFRLFSDGVDLAAFTLCAWHFYRSQRSRRAWIRRRCEVEMLRQWCTVDYPLGLTLGQGDITSKFENFRQKVALSLAGNADLLTIVQNLTKERATFLENGIKSLSQLSRNDFLYYLHRRPIRQARWFQTASSRIKAQNRSREYLLLVLFVSAAFISLAKLLYSVDSNRFSFLAPYDQSLVLIFLISIGVSSTLTSVYLGQNLRSIAHRYGSQLRLIGNWFQEFGPLVDSVVAMGSDPTREHLLEVSAAVGAFEYLTFAELDDWIRITELDGMELAPS